VNEVSCRAIETLFPAFEAMGIPLERVVEGLPVSIEHLRDPSQRVDWETNVRILERAEELLGPEGIAELGPPALDSAPMRLYRLLGVFVADTRYLYRMVCRWMGPSFFTHVQFAYDEVSDGRVRIEMEIPRSYRGSALFFQVFEAGLRAIPHLLGHRDAAIEANISPWRATFLIRAPRRATLLGRLRRLLHLPAAARDAYEELTRQHHHLNRALDEVRGAQQELRGRVEQIATLDRLGRTLSRQLGSDQLPDRILDFLTDRFDWSGASLVVKDPGDEALLFFGRSGRTDGAASASHALDFGGRSLGHLEVWERPDAEPGTDRELLEHLLPWIAMTVTKARAVAHDHGEGEQTGFRWASQSGRDLFMILDQNARILYAGPHVDEVLGYEADDLMRMDMTDLIHPDDWPQLAEDFARLARHSSSAMYSSARVQGRGGSFRRMEGVAIKVLSEAGAGVYLISCGEVGDRNASH
jgi:PAS domain S-box-containing protein